MSAIYRGYDQEALDAQYNARATAPDFSSLMQRYADESRIAREKLPCFLNVAYGEHPDEVLDVFPAAVTPAPGSGAPVFFWVHGGYWRMQSKDDGCNMAAVFTQAGAIVVTVNYSLAPAVSLEHIVDQVRRAVAWTYRNIGKYGGDARNLHIGGSSAGAHLAAMVLARGWRQKFQLPESLVKSALLLSGLYDLTPLPRTFVNEWLSLTSESASQNSPDQYLPENGCPIVVSYGDTETDEFKRQSDAYLELWRARGFEGCFVRVPGLNHFDIVLELGKLCSLLTQAALRQIGLA